VSQPFSTTLRRGSGEPRDLIARVDAEVGKRIAEAVDFVCLESMVLARRAAGLPAPSPANGRDRAEFDRRVESLLARVADAMLATLDTESRRAIETGAPETATRLAQLLSVQVALAKRLPDYWQRFEQLRAADAGPTETSGRDRAGWLDRFLGG
jgi:hypothetical protein